MHKIILIVKSCARHEFRDLKNEEILFDYVCSIPITGRMLKK